MNEINLKTLTGLTVTEMYVKLDEQLPADAYTSIVGSHGKDGGTLTDINPNWATDTLNAIFGPCGLGWGYAYDPINLTLTIEQRKNSKGDMRRVCLAVLTKLSVWYKLVKPDGTETLCQIDAGGASDNDDEAYAIKGAITYAIGTALSKIGWQKSVYLGRRSHLTVKKPAPAAAAPKPAPAVAKAPAKPAPAAAPKPAPKAAAPAANDGEIADADGPVEEERRAEPVEGFNAKTMTIEAVRKFVVPTGAWKDKTFQEVEEAGESGQKAIEFWSHMNAGEDLDKQALKAVALRYQELAKSNHKVATPA